MTDLDRHVAKPGRDKLVKQVRAKLMSLELPIYFFNLFL